MNLCFFNLLFPSCRSYVILQDLFHHDKKMMVTCVNFMALGTLCIKMKREGEGDVIGNEFVY